MIVLYLLALKMYLSGKKMQQRAFIFYKFRIDAFVFNVLQADAKWHEM